MSLPIGQMRESVWHLEGPADQRSQFQMTPGPLIHQDSSLEKDESQLHFWHELSEASSRKPGAPTVHQELPDVGCLGAGEVYPAESILKDRYPSYSGLLYQAYNRTYKLAMSR